MNNECIPLKEAAYTQKITVHVGTTAAVGKTFSSQVKGRQSGGLAGLAADPLAAGDGSDYIVDGPAPAHGPVGGVFNWDQVVGGKVPITRGAGTILPITSGGAIAVDDLLTVDNQGRVVTAAQTAGGSQPAVWVVGRAQSVATGAGQDVEVSLLDPFLY